MVTPQMVLRGAIARTGVRPFPLSLTYEVTWLCNLTCGYCDRHTPMRHELTQEEIFCGAGRVPYAWNAPHPP